MHYSEATIAYIHCYYTTSLASLSTFYCPPRFPANKFTRKEEGEIGTQKPWKAEHFYGRKGVVERPGGYGTIEGRDGAII